MAERDFNINFRTKADSSGAKQVEKDLQKVTGATKKNTAEAKKATTENKKLGDSLKGIASKIPGGEKAAVFFGGITKGAGAAVAAIGAVVAALASYIGLVKGGLGKIAITQDLEASFSTLLQSADLATSRMQELTAFAAKTPFSVPGIADASRLLEVLAGDALSTGDALNTIGDVAAGVSKAGESLDATMQNVALHVGRLHSALEDGNGEIGVSLLRLQELGIIGGRTAQRVRELHEEGGRGAEAYALLNKEFGKFAGEMERRSATINGRISNLSDTWSQFLSAVAAPFAAPFAAGISTITSVLEGARGAIHEFNVALGFSEVSVRKLGTAATDIDKLSASLINMEEAAEAAGEEYKATLDGIAKKHEELNKAQASELDFIDARAKAYQELAIAQVKASNLSESEKENKIALLEASGTIEQQRRRIALDIAAEQRARRRLSSLQSDREFAAQRLQREERDVGRREQLELRLIESLNDIVKIEEKKIRELTKEQTRLQRGASGSKNYLSLRRGTLPSESPEGLARVQTNLREATIARRSAIEELERLGVAGGKSTGASDRLNKEREEAAQARALFESFEPQITEAGKAVSETTERAARTISIVAAQNQTEILSLENQLSNLVDSRESIIGFMVRIQDEQARLKDEVARLQLQQRYNRP